MSVNFNKNATINTTGISETLINPFDTEFYYEPDNTAWVRLVHHNDPSTNRFVNTDTFASSVYKSVNLWFNVALCNLVNKYEFMVKQTLTAGGTEEKYRWIQTKNPLEAVYEDVAIYKQIPQRVVLVLSKGKYKLSAVGSTITFHGYVIATKK